VFVGRPGYDAISWTTPKQKRFVAQFDLGVDSEVEDGKTDWKTIRVFDGLGKYSAKHVRKGQTGVLVEAWGKKHWTYEGKNVEGYIARKVKVPKHYIQAEQQASSR
jgi:single-stranded DNA-binding protein